MSKANKIERLKVLQNEGYSRRAAAATVGINESSVRRFEEQGLLPKWYGEQGYNHPEGKPKVLILDIETSPIISAVWMLFKQNVGLNQIKTDWYVISWSAKWLGSDEVFYMDKRDSWDNEDDYELLEGIWKLIDEADWIVTQNGVKFDMKKLNARFILNGMKPPSSYKNIDTLLIAKSHFGFTSNKLEYMTDKLCKKYKKLTHAKYAGYELWKQCLLGNMDAWRELEQYNCYDVYSLEELYTILRPWYKKHPNPNLYHDKEETQCTCGSTNLEANGFHYTGVSKFVRLQCQDCGAEVRERINVLSKDKRKSIKSNIG